MRIVAIDPGTITAGYGVVDVDGSCLVYDECGIIPAPRKLEKAARVGHIGSEIITLIREKKPDALVYEHGHVGENPQSALAVGEARGAVYLAAHLTGVSLTGYTVAQARAAVAHGRATKEECRKVVMRLLGMHREPSLDASDALVLACAHGRLHRTANVIAKALRAQKREAA